MIAWILGPIIGAILTWFLWRKNREVKESQKAPDVLIRTPDGFVTHDTHLKKVREEYLREKEAWLVEYTDPLFGRPNDSKDVQYFELARSSWDKEKVLNEYFPPFCYSGTGKVLVITDQFPLSEQKFIYEWMTDAMEDLSDQITALLQRSSSGLSDMEIKTAFRPERIRQIEMQGRGPVKWTISFDTDIGEGEAYSGIARGRDQKIDSVVVGWL